MRHKILICLFLFLTVTSVTQAADFVLTSPDGDLGKFENYLLANKLLSFPDYIEYRHSSREKISDIINHCLDSIAESNKNQEDLCFQSTKKISNLIWDRSSHPILYHYFIHLSKHSKKRKAFYAELFKSMKVFSENDVLNLENSKSNLSNSMFSRKIQVLFPNSRLLVNGLNINESPNIGRDKIYQWVLVFLDGNVFTRVDTWDGFLKNTKSIKKTDYDNCESAIKFAHKNNYSDNFQFYFNPLCIHNISKNKNIGPDKSIYNKNQSEQALLQNFLNNSNYSDLSKEINFDKPKSKLWLPVSLILGVIVAQQLQNKELVISGLK